MNIEEILTQWKKDSAVDMQDLGSDVAGVSSLHAKYLEEYVKEKVKLIQLKSEYANIKRLRWEYWNGMSTEETLKANGWEPQPLKLLKADIQMYLDSDPILAKHILRINLQEEKITLLESIVKNINGRGFNIKAAIDYVKFKSGN